MELTKTQTEHQDRVDNAIYACLCELRDDFETDWNVELIGNARDALYDILVEAGINHLKYPEV